jgi:hypothetical protein
MTDKRYSNRYSDRYKDRYNSDTSLARARDLKIFHLCV